ARYRACAPRRYTASRPLHIQPVPPRDSLGRLCSQAAGFAQRSSYIIARHLLAPEHVEVGIVERLGGAVGRFGGFANGIFGQSPADDGLLGVYRLDRVRTHTAK